ncbi:MAG: HIT family protein [Candidatus Lokiarchaeota archaeon]|nr:HIT family protein [Candidatus Lokiarchaeota archaeon]
MNKEECIFCKIIRKEIPSKIIFEDDKNLAFLDINPISEGHSLIILKNHYETLENIPDKDLINLFQVVRDIAKKIFEKLNIDGYHILQNNYKAAGQEVNHFHIHIIPRKEGDNKIKLNLPERGASEESLNNILEKLKS